MRLNKKKALFFRLNSMMPMLRADYGVKRLGVFGSYAEGRATAKSDLDLVVQLARPIGFRFFDLKDVLERETGRSVDLLTRDSVRQIRSTRARSSIRRQLKYV
jgi:hypothetical protein